MCKFSNLWPISVHRASTEMHILHRFHRNINCTLEKEKLLLSDDFGPMAWTQSIINLMPFAEMFIFKWVFLFSQWNDFCIISAGRFFPYPLSLFLSFCGIFAIQSNGPANAFPYPISHSYEYMTTTKKKTIVVRVLFDAVQQKLIPLTFIFIPTNSFRTFPAFICVLNESNGISIKCAGSTDYMTVENVCRTTLFTIYGGTDALRARTMETNKFCRLATRQHETAEAVESEKSGSIFMAGIFRCTQLMRCDMVQCME